MSGFADLTEILDPTLTLSVRGKPYAIHPPRADVGLRLQALAVAGLYGRDKLTDEQAERLFGADDFDHLLESVGRQTWQQMLDDGVTLPELKHIGMTAFFYWTQGEAMALAFWNAPAGKARRGRKEPQDRRTSTSTAAASTTKRRGSGSGTRSRSTSKRGSGAAPRA